MRQQICVTVLLMVFSLVLFGCGDVNVPDTHTDGPTVSGAAGGIRGQVLPTGIGASILVIKEDIIVANPQVDPDGSYTIPELAPGEYDLEILAPQHFVDVSQRQIKVFAGEWTEVVDVRLRPWSDAAILSGVVLDAATDEPVSNAGVLVQCTTSVCSPLSTATQEDGTFSLQLWPDLTSTVTIRKTGYQTDLLRVQALGARGQTALEIRLQPTAPASPLTG